MSIFTLLLLLFFICWFFHSHFLFDIIPHPSVDCRQVLRPILYFQPSHGRAIRDTFIFQSFRYLLAASATVLSGHFFTQRRFLPYTPSRHFHRTCFYQRFTETRQLLFWKSQGFILILETQTRSISLFDSQQSTIFYTS